MLRASLKNLYSIDHLEQALSKIGHPITARPEELTIDEFIALFSLLNA